MVFVELFKGEEKWSLRLHYLYIFPSVSSFVFHRKDHAKAVEILVKELKVFSTFNEELFKEITMLLTLTNFR